VLKIAALLHDIACFREFRDTTGKSGSCNLGAGVADKIVASLGYSEKRIAIRLRFMEFFFEKLKTGIEGES
jgi:hypothetical protein